MSEAHAASAPENLPEPSPELVLFRAQTEAICAVLGRKKGMRFLETMASIIMAEENMSKVELIRRSPTWDQSRLARQEAAAFLSRHLPNFLYRLPSKR